MYSIVERSDFIRIPCFLTFAFAFVFVEDQGLDFILEELETLKNLAHDMNEVGYAHAVIFDSWYEFYIYIYVCYIRRERRER